MLRHPGLFLLESTEVYGKSPSKLAGCPDGQPANPASGNDREPDPRGPMKAILGLSAYYHDSAAALVVDGQVVAAAQEER